MNIVTMEHKEEVICNLPNGDMADNFEWPLKVVYAFEKVVQSYSWSYEPCFINKL